MLPKALYEILPFAYVIIGMLVMVLLDNQLALVSSLIMICTALVIASLRFFHRHAQEHY